MKPSFIKKVYDALPGVYVCGEYVYKYAVEQGKTVIYRGPREAYEESGWTHMEAVYYQP